MKLEVLQLRDMIENRDGALSRASERLGVSRPTIRKWFSGEWEPGEATLGAIRVLVSSGTPLEARRKGRSGRPVANP